MGTLINFALKFSGIQKAWDFMDGKKTYISATLAILSGFLGVANEVVPLLSAHDAGGIWTLLKHLPQDQSWLMLVGGLGTLGIGHKLEKAADDSGVTVSGT